MKYHAVATCLFGLEKIVEFELKKTGAADTKAENGRVFFTADEMGLAEANICSRTAERILLLIAQFKATDFDMLFEQTYSVGWGEYIERKDAFPVKGYSINSKLSSVPAMQSVIKKAIAERLSKHHNTRFLTEKSGITKQIRFSVIRDCCILMLDTSGEGLHKRGYRPLTHEAPIRETLAAGIVDFARIKPDSRAADPFCGSGSLLIEAAMKAKNIAPGLKRSFAGEGYGFIGKKIFDQARQKVSESINRESAFFARGYDTDRNAVENASRNAKNAGVDDVIFFEQADARRFKTEPNEIILANPPYGKRMDSLTEAEKLLSDFFTGISKQQFKGLYIISSHPDFEKVAGMKAARRRKLYNGMIECQLYMYFNPGAA